MAALAHKGQVIMGGDNGVTSWNGRSGSVLPMAGDYNATQINYDSSTTVKDELDNIEDDIDGINLVNCDSPDVYIDVTKSGTADNFTVSSTSAGKYKGIGWHIPVKPNTSYTISADVVVSSGSGYFAVRTGDNKSQITALNIPTSSDGVVLRFNSGSETMVRAYVYCTAGTSESGSVTYKDYKITETRFEDVPYRPYNQQSIQHQINDVRGVWTTPVSCLTGDTSATINNSAIHTTSTIKAYSETSSGTPVGYEKIVVTEGQAVITFASALTEAANIKLNVLNV